MNIQEVFWQNKISPKQLVLDWDKFISLFQEFILETISIKLNFVQKQYIKFIIDPQNRDLVYKNSYLLFVKNFWQLPSNRMKLLKGQLNLSKMPKIKFISDIKSQSSVLLRISYFSDVRQNTGSKKMQGNRLTQTIYQLQNKNFYKLDTCLNVISESNTRTQNFLTIGRNPTNDITIDSCQSFNPQHLKLIRILSKIKKQKKTSYIQHDQQERSYEQIRWYIRDVSKSNRLDYLLTQDTKYVVMKQGLIVKIGMLDQFELHIIKATSEQLSSSHLKQLSKLLNQERINYLGEIDPQVAEKYIIQIPTKQIKNSDIGDWFDKGFNYEQPKAQINKKSISDSIDEQQEVSLSILLVNRITQQRKKYQFFGKNLKVGRNKQNQIIIDKVSMRDVQCQFKCIAGVWLLKNSASNCSTHNKPNQQINKIKKLRIKQLSVGLTCQDMVQNLRNSDRMQLNSLCNHQLRGNNFVINISFPENKIRNKN